MNTNRNTSGIVIGIVLVVIGVFALFGNIFTSWNMDNLWPLVIAGVGVVFFVVMALGDQSRAGLAVPGSILVTVGLIMYWMNLTDTWESWAYCWALVMAASGAGVWISGIRSGRADLKKSGLDALRGGLTLFLVFAIIMEFIFTVTRVHQRVNILSWAILLAVLGLFLLIVRLLRLGKPEGKNPDLFWPVLMIGAGLIAAFYQLKWIPADNLWKLLNLWPLLLIVAGLGIIARSRAWMGLLLGALVVGGLLFVGFNGAQLNLPTQPSWITDFGDIDFGDGDREQVTGSGKQVTEDRPVSGVDRVELMIPAKLEIVQGSSEGLTITADDNLLPLLTTNVSNGKLNIRYKPQYEVRAGKMPQITLTVKDLQSLRVSSSGTVMVGSLETGDFELDLSSSGSITIEDLQADKVNADLTSSGDILLGGSANELVLDVSSSGTFDAGGLQVKSADVELTSSGNVTLWVMQDLRARLSSSGNVYYYGSPELDENRSSSGKVISKGDK
jgi:hypothetical protein